MATPNPFTDQLRISLPLTSKHTSISLYNVMGMVLYKKVLAADRKSILSIPAGYREECII
jgi:hypothetical protein